MMNTVIAGFDAYDPRIFEKLHGEGKVPFLGKLVASGGYSRFAVTDPPQSEVSWTSIATGMNPGFHGIFDFVHRNPADYSPQVSLLPTKSNVLGTQFVPPHEAKTIFEVAVDDGYPGISLWWPATFPAKQASPVWSLPGLGTPDIFGRLGVGVFYSLDRDRGEGKKTRVELLTRINEGNFQGTVEGPSQLSFSGPKSTMVNFRLNQVSEGVWRLIIGKDGHELRPGTWSDLIEISFSVGLGIGIKAVTRAILSVDAGAPGLYFLPLQLHPLRSPWPYGTPKRLMKGIWKNPGPYLTLGWPQDTTGLEEGFISDDQFLSLCDDILTHREHTLMWLLDSFQEGVLGCVFDSLDRVQHMFFHDRMDIIESWYVKLDALFGRILDKITTISNGKDIRVLAVSDHGFGKFDNKVNLNRWLLNRGYLVSRNQDEKGNLDQVNWESTTAYAVGLNSIYVNLQGREGQGSVASAQKDTILNNLKGDLLRWESPDGSQVVVKTSSQKETFEGPLVEFGPDLVVGYNAGFRASRLTGMGEWGLDEIEANNDHWGADHCFASESVPGVIFSSDGLKDFSDPSYKDIPFLTLGKEIDPRRDLSGPTYSDEDQDKINERMRELGYL